MQIKKIMLIQLIVGLLIAIIFTILHRIVGEEIHILSYSCGVVGGAIMMGIIEKNDR